MSSRNTGLAIASLVLSVVAFRGAGAQLDQPPGMIQGRLHLPGDTTPVVGAVVTIVGARDQQVTDIHGGFFFGNIRPGRYEIRVRRLGMQQLVKIVTVGPSEVVPANWEMGLLPKMLTEVVVHGEKVRVAPEFQEAFRRAAIGFGDYFLASDIRRRNPLDTRSLLQDIPGVSVNVRGVRFERCGTESLDPTLGTTLVSDNVGSQGALGMQTLRAADVQDLGIQVYVDGHRMTGMYSSVDDVLNSVTPSEIEIMEVYRGVARIPAEYLRDACAVIAIWTKRG